MSFQLNNNEYALLHVKFAISTRSVGNCAGVTANLAQICMCVCPLFFFSGRSFVFLCFFFFKRLLFGGASEAHVVQCFLLRLHFLPPRVLLLYHNINVSLFEMYSNRVHIHLTLFFLHLALTMANR